MEDSKKPVRLVVGCMTGTSLDGLDAALVEIHGRGLTLKQNFLGMHSVSLGTLKDELRHFASGRQAEPWRYMAAARALGELHAEAVMELCRQTQVKHADLDFVVAHGQTIWHAPKKYGSGSGMSWQLFDPWPLVRRLKTRVCYDLRQADLIAGGQGAPITPLSDFVMYRQPGRTRVVANLGGICNITVLPSKAKIDLIQGGDIGPCNILIDGVVQALFPGKEYDAGGAIASGGKVQSKWVKAVLAHPFFKVRARGGVRSTGREDFNPAWVASIVTQAASQKLSASDVVASAVAAVGRILKKEVERAGATEVVLAGGGAKNNVLVEAIRSGIAPARTILSDEFGIPVDAREAIAFAVLGALSADGVPISLPRITRATSPGVAGAWVGT